MRALIGMVQALRYAGNLHRLVHFGDQLVDGHAGRHSDLGLEVDHGLEHFQRRRIGGGGGAPGLAEHRCHFGKALDDLVLGLQQLPPPWSPTCAGSVAGMYSSVPSFSVGMNSLPSCIAG